MAERVCLGTLVEISTELSQYPARMFSRLVSFFPRERRTVLPNRPLPQLSNHLYSPFATIIALQTNH